MGCVSRSVDDQGDGREGDPYLCAAALYRGHLRGKLRLGPLDHFSVAARALAVQDSRGRRVVKVEGFSVGEGSGARASVVQHCPVHGTLVELNWYPNTQWTARSVGTVLVPGLRR